MTHGQLLDTALSLSQSERADLAYQLLQSLDPPGEEISSEEFGAQLRERLASYQRGETKSFTRDEARQIIREGLAKGQVP